MSALAWLQIGILAALFVALYRWNLDRLWAKTNPISGDPNWGHAAVVPLVGLYYLYQRRSDLLATPVRPVLPSWPGSRLKSVLLTAVAGVTLWLAFPPAFMASVGGGLANGERLAYMAGSVGFCVLLLSGLAMVLNWGLAFLIAGLTLGAYGIWPGQNDYVWDLGLIVTLFGTVLTLAGWGVMRIAWFPIVFLVCALPWPPLVYSMLANPLQHLAAWVAVGTLQVAQVDATYTGTRIEMPTGRVLNVAEACAGLRSLMTFVTLGAAVAFLSARPLWQKLVITFSAVPIAILCNVARVSGMGLLDHYWSEDFSKGFAHAFAGMVMLIPGFFMLLGVGWVLDQLFVEEAGADETGSRGGSSEARSTRQADDPQGCAAVSGGVS